MLADPLCPRRVICGPRGRKCHTTPRAHSGGRAETRRGQHAYIDLMADVMECGADPTPLHLKIAIYHRKRVEAGDAMPLQLSDMKVVLMPRLRAAAGRGSHDGPHPQAGTSPADSEPPGAPNLNCSPLPQARRPVPVRAP